MSADIYLYNPTNELAVANGDPNYMPPKRLLQFEKDLSSLPMFFAGVSDIVLVKELPQESFLTIWQKAGKEIPEFLKEKEAIQDKKFCHEPKGFLHPWGWSPAVHKRLAPLKDACSVEFKNSPIANWSEASREIYSRKTALTILTNVFSRLGERSWLLPESESPVVCHTLDEITGLQKKWGKLVVKSPWSSSGRGIQMLRNREFNQTNRQVVSGFLKQQGYVMAEPWHNKVADLSLHFYSHGNGEVTFRGLASFLTDSAGRYQGSFIGELPFGLSMDEKDFLAEHLTEIKMVLQESLIHSELSRKYYGWIGVDLLYYRDDEDKFRLHPCLEINCRYNMGALTLQLREMISPQSTGRWEITSGKPGQLANEMKAKMSLFPIGMHEGKIAEGVIPMVPPTQDAKFGAWLKVERI